MPLEAGAVALLGQRPLDLDVPQVVVADTRAAMAPVAASFFDHPSRRLAVAGITGTNGKTTATHLLGAVLEAAGRPSAVIGTLTGARTTPEAPELQGRLAEMAGRGVQAVAMEVSSHALVQHRVDATWFEVVAFTNLSQDHLDYHASMDEYFAAKSSLFDPDRARVGVINVDDPWGRRLSEATALPVRPFSMADATDLELNRDGSTFRWEGHVVRLRLAGEFNVVNALAAAAVARELAVAPDAVAAGLSALASVPGRFERVDGGGPIAVFVDYAHTPAGLEHVLEAARPLGRRVLVVFGCGGDRDRGKRPAMGEVATRLADVAVLTSDNPRSEDPLAIIEEVRSGVRRPEVLTVEPDRRTAIALALAEAGAGDVVIIAGKGHETTLVSGGREEPFDDRTVARELLSEMSP
ncbi:MAG: UDP-N-acetylmuramoyl-L-alanyl-D-glutamate--2,6-diaminopimelate ligase [Actinobacteria bacterium]|nr:UDP-N-acetylmuramoyl-L-alanyl-D-glutamate--2,6-diaminopimelate ligase [Actinomycetota bacterium]